VHRDIKLPNILINFPEFCGNSHYQRHQFLKDKDLLTLDFEVKVADFGLARFTSEEMMVSNVGTPYTMSPQTLAEGAYTCKTDVFSLGVILYQLLTGEYPFKARN